MSWVLPLPLLLFAGVVALVPLAAVVRRPTSAPRLVVEAFAGGDLRPPYGAQDLGASQLPALRGLRVRPQLGVIVRRIPHVAPAAGDAAVHGFFAAD